MQMPRVCKASEDDWGQEWIYFTCKYLFFAHSTRNCACFFSCVSVAECILHELSISTMLFECIRRLLDHSLSPNHLQSLERFSSDQANSRLLIRIAAEKLVAIFRPLQLLLIRVFICYCCCAVFSALSTSQFRHIKYNSFKIGVLVAPSGVVYPQVWNFFIDKCPISSGSLSNPFQLNVFRMVCLLMTIYAYRWSSFKLISYMY